MGLFDKKPQEDDRTVFIEETLKLLEPHVEEELRSLFRNEEIEALGKLDEFRLLHKKLLGRFFDLAKSEAALNKFMFPIMMYLRNARKRSGKQ